MMPRPRISVNVPEIIETLRSLTHQGPSLNNPDKPDLNPEKVKYFTSPFVRQGGYVGTTRHLGTAEGVPTTHRKKTKGLKHGQG
jgi:hypothetical protein